MKYVAAYVYEQTGVESSARLISFPYRKKHIHPNDAFLDSGYLGSGLASEKWHIAPSEEEARDQAEAAYKE